MNYSRLTHDTFYLTDEQLENSPSRKDGIDKDTEAELRAYGCTLVEEAGILLGFQQAVMATGQVLLHRFYCKRSMKHYNVKKVAATALWHGAKLEEVTEVSGHPRELLNRVMVAIDRCIARRETPEGRKISVLDLHSKEAEEFRRSLIRYELEMLKVFGFITHVEHPHKVLLNYIQVLGFSTTDMMGSHFKVEEPICPEFLQEALNIANDSLRTTLCVRYKGSVVACGIIFYTSRRLKVPLPESPPWWSLFGVTLSQMCEVAATLHQLYKAPQPRFIPVCHQLLPSKPPTPASTAAPADGAVPDTGATPLPGRPGGKPLDPSVRRTLGDLSTRVVGATPGQGGLTNGTAAAAVVSSNPAVGSSAPPSAAPSPQRSEGPGSARKRSRSRSPGGEDSRKRQQRDSSQPLSSQQQQGASPVRSVGQRDQQPGRPSSASGPRRSRYELDMDRDREYSSRGGSSRQRSRSRDREFDRGRRRSSRSRSREHGHGSNRSSKGDRNNKEHEQRDRARRHRGSSRERTDRNRHRQQHQDRDRDRERRDGHDSRGKEQRRVNESSRDKQQLQPQPKPVADKAPAVSPAVSDTNAAGKVVDHERETAVGSNRPAPPSTRFPPPPAANASSVATASGDSSRGDAYTDRACNADKDAIARGVHSPDSTTVDRPAAATVVADAAAAPALRPKPVAVRKKLPQQQSANAASAAAQQLPPIKDLPPESK